ncbi:hypothetical protein CR513_19393, partial [Mucuna pruriens]
MENGEELAYLGDSKPTPILGKGKVILKLTSSKTLALVYEPFIQINLVLVALLGKVEDELFNMFLTYKVEVQNKLNKKIKRIRSDRGGEYTLFNNFCERKDIIHEVTPPNSSKSNGGCLAQVMLLDPKKRKIRPKTSDCMFLGYVMHSVAYMFLILKSDLIDCNTIIETKNAEFFEDTFPLEPSSELVNGDLRRRKRRRKETSFGDDLYTYLVDDDPMSFLKASNALGSKLWEQVIRTRIKSIKKNNRWKLVDLPRGAKSIGCKWIFEKKLNLNPLTSIKLEHLHKL